MPYGKLEDYFVIETIGIGSFGECQKIRRKSDGKVLVWKVIDYGSMTESEKQQLVREVNLLREFRHQNIVRYCDRIIDKSHSKLYIVTEYCSGGDLATLISKKLMSEEFVWKVMEELSLALSECHKSKENEGGKVVHRDIKPANVFLDGERHIKLGDFGLARILHNTSLAKTFVGTPYYMSPPERRPTVSRLLHLAHEKTGKLHVAPLQAPVKKTGDYTALSEELKRRQETIAKKEEMISKKEEELVKREHEIKRKEDILQKREQQVLTKERQLAAILEKQQFGKKL